MPDTLDAAARDRSQEAFARELDALIDRYRMEWDLSVGGCIGVLLGQLLDVWFDGAVERFLAEREGVEESDDADAD